VDDVEIEVETETEIVSMNEVQCHAYCFYTGLVPDGILMAFNMMNRKVLMSGFDFFFYLEKGSGIVQSK